MASFGQYFTAILYVPLSVIGTSKDGYITIPDRPGLGIDIDEEACLLHPYKPHTLRHYDGTLTDIRPAKTEFYF